MVTACKNYITDYGMSRIWDQSYKTLIDKLQVSVKLYKEYQTCFHKAKKKIEAIPEERPFDFSEMYIFGKFDAFCKRIDKVQHCTDPETCALFSLFLLSLAQTISCKSLSGCILHLICIYCMIQIAITCVKKS